MTDDNVYRPFEDTYDVKLKKRVKEMADDAIKDKLEKELEVFEVYHHKKLKTILVDRTNTIEFRDILQSIHKKTKQNVVLNMSVIVQKKELKNINIKQLLVFIKNVPVNHTKEASKMNKFMEYLNKKKIPFKRKLPSADGKYFIMIK